MLAELVARPYCLFKFNKICLNKKKKTQKKKKKKMRSSNLKALTKTVITYRFVFDIIKCRVWF